MTRPVGRMDLDDFQIIVEKLIKRKARITLSGMGNPVAHPQWKTMLDWTKAQKGHIGLQVNAVHLTSAVVEGIRFTRPNFVFVSVPSIKKKIASHLMPEASVDELVRNVLHAHNRCMGRVPITVFGLQTALDRETQDFVRFWKKHHVPAKHWECHSRGGSLEQTHLLATTSNVGISKPCGLFAQHAFVTWQGDLLACCHDLLGETKLGNLLDDAITDLAGAKAEKLGKVPHFFLCRRCDEPLRRAKLPSGNRPNSKTGLNKALKRFVGTNK